MTTPAEYWDQRYSERPRMWGGQANAALVELVAELAPARALDLGCGEGGDAIWLAGLGWQVTAVDISAVALQRAAEDAQSAGVAERISFVQADLAHDFPPGEFELVSAPFLQTVLEFPRALVLQRAAAAVAPGGLLAIIEHAAPPPWSQHQHAEFPTVEQTLASLELPEEGWQVLQAEVRHREGSGPDGQHAHLADNVIAARRTAAAAG